MKATTVIIWTTRYVFFTKLNPRKGERIKITNEDIITTITISIKIIIITTVWFG